jgi:hypothetical protein
MVCAVTFGSFFRRFFGVLFVIGFFAAPQNTTHQHEQKNCQLFHLLFLSTKIKRINSLSAMRDAQFSVAEAQQSTHAAAKSSAKLLHAYNNVDISFLRGHKEWQIN